MRINVRDFEEGVEYFGAKGYKLFMGPFENEYARVGIMPKVPSFYTKG
jgi:hypothetical protein